VRIRIRHRVQHVAPPVAAAVAADEQGGEAQDAQAGTVRQLRASVKVLKQSVSRKTKVISNLRSQLIRCKRQLTRSRALADKRKHEIEELKCELKAERAKACFTRPHKSRNAESAHMLRLTIPGAYRLAIKRNLGHVGQCALARMFDQEIGRWAITRSERLLGSYFVLVAQRWYAACYTILANAMQQVCPHCTCCSIHFSVYRCSLRFVLLVMPTGVFYVVVPSSSMLECSSRMSECAQHARDFI
jgi:hypothetical protein